MADLEANKIKAVVLQVEANSDGVSMLKGVVKEKRGWTAVLVQELINNGTLPPRPKIRFSRLLANRHICIYTECCKYLSIAFL
eukprot:8560290-Karenia_brevis.AAC.1